MGEYVYRYNCRAGELHRTRFVIWTKAAVCVWSSELLKLRGIIIILLSASLKKKEKCISTPAYIYIYRMPDKF